MPVDVEAPAPAPASEVVPRNAVVHLALANFVPDPPTRGQVGQRVSRSMTATGVEPLVRPDMDGASIEQQAKQAREARGPPPPPAP